MKFWPLIWSALRRKKVRTFFTLLSILIAFLLFGYLAAINTAFSLEVRYTGSDRLIMRHKVGLLSILLPESYLPRIEATSGVVQATHGTMLGGIYQDPKQIFAQLAVQPDRILKLYPEFRLPEDQYQAWLADRSGAIVGRKTAERFGWKIGDRIPLQAPWRKRDGSSTWEFNLDGIYDGAQPGTDTTLFFFHYDYFDEARAFSRGEVGWFYIRVNDPARADAIAHRLDAQFANSFYETKTSTEKAFLRSFARQIGDIGLIIEGILTAVFFTMLLVTSNTMMQSVRERTMELAVLKTVGFSNPLVLGLVLAESLVLAAVGGGLGLGLAYWAVQQGDPTGWVLPMFYLPLKDLVLGSGIIVALGLLTGILPAVQAMRLRVVDALRRV